MGLCVRRIQLNRRLVARGGFIVASVARENLPQIVSANRRIGPQLHGSSNERERGRQIAELQRNDAEQVQRVRVLRRVRQYRAIALLRLAQTAGPMVLERKRERFINALLRHPTPKDAPRLSARARPG